MGSTTFAITITAHRLAFRMFSGVACGSVDELSSCMIDRAFTAARICCGVTT